MKKTVLLVDDDIDFLAQTEMILKQAGYSVVAKESRKDAEEWLGSNQPDLAIIDLMMEEMDGGFQLAYHIKKKSASIPVILATAVTQETGLTFDAATDEEKAWVRADVLLTKPFRKEQLINEIEALTGA